MDESYLENVPADFQFLVEEARTNYLAFYTLMALRPDARKVLGEFHISLCKLVQAVHDGEKVGRQTTSGPPQHGKSEVLVRFAIPWLMGVRPGVQIGLAAYDFALVEELSMAGQEIITHPWYRLVFPKAGIDPKLRRIVNWGTVQGSRVRAVSFGKAIVGRRVDWFIGDDLYKSRADVESKTIRRKVEKWFFSDCFSRISPNAVIWLLGTRWHPEDLQGYLQGDDYRKRMEAAGQTAQIYEHTNYTAVCETTEKEPVDPLGREEGEVLCPELGRDHDFLDGVKEVQPPYEWSSQYQGRPKTSSSGQVDLSRLRYLDREGQIPKRAVFARGWDLAAKAKEQSDYSAGAKCAWDRKTGTFYIVDMWRKKLPWPKLKKRIVGIGMTEVAQEDYPVHKIGVEAVAGFEHSYQDLKELLSGRVRVERRNPRGKDKLVRAMPWFNKVEVRKVVLIRGEWNNDFLSELESFPMSDNDDQIDAVTIAHEVLTKGLKIKYA